MDEVVVREGVFSPPRRSGRGQWSSAMTRIRRSPRRPPPSCTRSPATTPLLDGNTRLAWAATRVFCLMNGRDLHYGVDEAEALVVAVSRGDLEVAAIAAWIAEHLRQGPAAGATR